MTGFNELVIQMNLFRDALVLTAVLLSTQSARADDAEALAERMLSVLGGRAGWASLRNTVNDSQQNRIEEPTELRAVISMEFDQPRFRIEMTAPDLHLIRVVDGENHWRLNRAGQIEDVPADTLAEDLRWYQGHVYRTLHRIAKRDPELTLRTAPENRLEVLEAGRRIAWYALDARGMPYAYGAHDDDTGSLFGPWDFEVEGIRHPVWVSNRDGSWRVRLMELSVNVDIDDSLFERPAAVESIGTAISQPPGKR